MQHAFQKSIRYQDKQILKSTQWL